LYNILLRCMMQGCQQPTLAKEKRTQLDKREFYAPKKGRFSPLPFIWLQWFPLLEYINYFVSLNNSISYATFLHKMMSLYPNIIPHFAENFQWTTFRFTETPCTISRSGDDRDCSIIFYWKQGYLKVNVRQLSYYVNFSFFLWNLVKKRTFCQKGRPLKKKGQNVSLKMILKRVLTKYGAWITKNLQVTFNIYWLRQICFVVLPTHQLT